MKIETMKVREDDGDVCGAAPPGSVLRVWLEDDSYDDPPQREVFAWAPSAEELDARVKAFVAARCADWRRLAAAVICVLREGSTEIRRFGVTPQADGELAVYPIPSPGWARGAPRSPRHD